MRWMVALAMLLLAANGRADELRPGFIELSERSATHWTLGWKQPLSAPGPAELIVPLVPAGCALAAPPQRRVAPLALVGSADLSCRGPLAGGRAGLENILGKGDVLLRVAPLGEPVQSYRLTAAAPSVVLPAKPATRQVWRSYFALGIEHILEGWDHLLFVVALVLVVRRGWAVAGAVTAFTAAHSLTLAGTTLGFVGLPAQPVEAVIALSIVFLAVELVSRREKSMALRFPWAFAFAFGLVHGFGFAGALAEIGLPHGEVPAALVSFNLGVEAGQLAVVAAVLAVLALLRRLEPRALVPALHASAYAIGITASYWLLDRLVA